MKALSLWQPWASLIAVGAKTVETRSWAAPQALVGQRIAVHAAKRASELHWVNLPIFHDALKRAEDAGDLALIDGRLPLGCIVASAVLVECFRMDHDTCMAVHDDMPEEYAFGDWRPGRFGWQLSELEPVAEPIPYRGAQGLFDALQLGAGLQACFQHEHRREHLHR